jgi:hypothetical protein
MTTKPPENTPRHLERDKGTLLADRVRPRMTEDDAAKVRKLLAAGNGDPMAYCSECIHTKPGGRCHVCGVAFEDLPDVMAMNPVPRVVHQMWLLGEPPPDARQMISRVRAIAAGQGWGYEWWTFDRLAATFPDFREREKVAPTVQYQADIGRWLVLLHHGGLYLDCDVDLWRLPEGLQGAWIQGIGDEKLANQNGAVIACPPGHRFMRDVLTLAADPEFHWPKLCGGCVLQARALGDDVRRWPETVWNGEGRFRGGLGWHRGKFVAWQSYRPRETP